MTSPATAIPTKKRILTATIAAFIITALLGTGVVVIVEKNRSQKQQKAVADITTRIADNIQDHLSRSISATYALAAIIRQNNGRIDNFEALASEMLGLYDGMSSLALAPQGVVSSIVPLAGNEKAMGHNLLEDVKRNKEAILAMRTRKLTLAGPFELVQGGRAVAGRLPVFITADGTDRFWGFVSVLVGIPQLIKSANLQHIVDSGYHYELSRIHPDSGKRDVFERSAVKALSSPASHNIEVPNGTWTLSVEQAGGWFSPFIIPSELMLVLLVSALISFMLHTLYKLPLTLQESEERFRALATIAPVGIFYTDSDGNCLYVNPAGCKMTGLSLEESLGLGWVKGLHPDDRDMVHASWNKMVESQGQWGLEYRFMTSEGKITWVYGLAATQFDASDKIIKYVGIMQDITERKQAEDTLRKSEERYRTNYRNTPAMLHSIDVNGRLISVSEYWLNILGYKRDEVIGRKSSEFLTAASRKYAVETVLPEFIKTGYCNNIEYQFVKKNGELIDTLLSAISETDENVELVRSLAVVTDITARKQAEEALRESEERFKALHNASFGGIAIHDQGVILDCNQGLSEISGFGRDELIGMNGLLLIAEQSRETVMNNIRSGYEKHYEAFGLRKNGEEYPLRLEARNIPYHGKMVRVVEFRDITARKQAEEALRESESKLKTLFTSMTEMVVLHELLCDGEGNPVNYRITDCNTAYTRITGITRENAVGRLATEVYGTEEPPYLKEFSEVAQSGEPYLYEAYFPPMDKHFFISVVSTEKNRFATVTTDISERKQAEEAIEAARKQLAAKNRELEQLVYVASHDLRSPLVNVDGFSRELEYSVNELSALLEGGGDYAVLKKALRAEFPDMVKSIGRIRASTRQMDNLLKAMLKLARAGRAALRIETLNMDELLGQLAQSFAFSLQETGITMTVEHLPPCQGDAVQVTQVFSNLIDNAIKYHEKNRQGVITIRGSGEGGRALYRVEDNGMGIAGNHREKIFDLFHRLNPKEGEGEGLGLTMVRQILGSMNGEITVESKPAEGSAFIVSLPGAKKNMQKT